MRRALPAAAVLLLALAGCGGTPTGAPAAAPTPAVTSAGPEPAYVPTADAAPLTTTAPTPTQVLEGRGDDVVELDTPVSFGVLVFECPRCTGNTVVRTSAWPSILQKPLQQLRGRRIYATGAVVRLPNTP